MNRIQQLFDEKDKNILSIYFTAGHPELNDTVEIIKLLADNRVNMIEVGMPFSDPLADGPVIQQSSLKALNNGMNLNLLFDQLKGIKNKVDLPILLMGYLNPVMQYGIEKFCEMCKHIGIDGVIIPDLPMHEYETIYKPIFEKNHLSNVFLVTPQTTEERIRKIDSLTNGFIYLVSVSSTTGTRQNVIADQVDYFNRIKSMKLKNPTMIGFGINDHESFKQACTYANGAIIGSAFIKALEQEGELEDKVSHFVKRIK